MQGITYQVSYLSWGVKDQLRLQTEMEKAVFQVTVSLNLRRIA